MANANIRKQSLGELEAAYQQRVKEWTAKRQKLETQIQECDRTIRAYQAKLHHVQALVGGTGAAAPAPPKKTTRRGRKKRTRSSPVKIATLEALRKRPGQSLTSKQIVTAIRKDSGRRVSRPGVNVNVNKLEAEGLIRRDRAPKGAGARWVFSAI